MEVGLYVQPPEGVDDFRRQLGLQPQDVLVTQVARLAELKGHEFILQAAAGLSDENIHFCFVGDGHLRESIEMQIHQMGLADRIHLTGLLRPEQIPLVLHASDIVVHCSLREGLARALPQAMLAAKPVVSFDIDGAAEVVNEQTGILLRSGDVDGLRQAMRQLAASAELRDKLGQAGRSLAVGRFDHNVMVERIEEVYGKVIGHRS
jgi:glycosyltransferase involved in cell wall biosynthesis